MADPFASQFVRNIDANRTIKEELTAAVRSQSARRRISVTDLPNPRQAFFRWTRPDIQPSPDRAQSMLSGTGFHAQFERAVSSEEFVEQFIEFQEIVGKIDIYDDVPVEVKTTSFMPQDGDLIRPVYVDQLGMYCAMTGVPSGRLIVYYTPKFSGTPDLRAFQLNFGDLDPIRAEMVRRRDLFRHALTTGDPSGLPQCEFFGRRCDYHDICGCESAAPLGRVVPVETVQVTRKPEVEQEIATKLQTKAQRSRAFRLNDLVFPRQTAFGRRAADEEEMEEETPDRRLKDLERRGFRDALYKAMQYSVPGAFKTVPVSLRTLTGRVSTFRGVPTLFRATGFRTVIDRDRLPFEMPWNLDRLAFECALAGSERGRLILYYKAIPDDKFMVYDAMFKDLGAIQGEADRRLALLESGAHPSDLPPCPTWMFKNCRFRDRCGCGEAA